MVVLRRWFLTVACLGLVVAIAAVAALLAWPGVGVASSTSGLAGISLPGFSGHIERVSVRGPDGTPVPVELRGGTVWPRVRLTPGERLTVTVKVRRPSWVSWLVGGQQKRTMTVVTPAAHIRSTLLRPKRGTAVAVRFAEPVSRVAIGGGRLQRLEAARSVVPLGIRAAGRATTGTTTVAAAVRSWETLSKPAHVAWFVPGARKNVVAEPAAGSRVSPLAPLTLTFARPVASVLGSRLPRFEPAMPGHWQQVDSNTLTFRPAGLGFGLGGIVRVRVPGGSLAWKVAGGSTLRLQEILARLGYLPVRWRMPAGSPSTPASEVAAAFSAPHGTFSWRFPGTPASLQTLWKPGSWNVVTQGAVMRFENVHGMATDGVAGPQVWRALLHDDLAGRRSDAGYNYVFVRESIPQSLSLWHNGRVIVTSPGNTGIAQAPTAQGTWPVFQHIPVGTMSGTNPDGTHYHDPGIRWISYFHGGDALHAFPRASFGTPQSLGCVELPDAAAAEVWPYTPIGTLVTIES
jgi:peptidoglycan hydrolase-like protein with peptidoglycan-binding domain